MQPVLAAFVFGYGAIIGSFLNAVIWRLRTGESIVRGRSHCPKCGHMLAAKDLIPALSWLLLKGRCRYCRQPISWQYLVMELVTGALFMVVAWPLGAGPMTATDLSWTLLAWFAVSIFLIVFVFDLKYMMILPKVTVPATVIALAANLALGVSWASLLLAILLGAGVFWVQYALSRGRWIGGGDIYLGALMGAVLGLPKLLLALFLAYVVGATVGLMLIVLKRKGWKSEVPFGTFLSGAAMFSLIAGQPVIDWYLRLIGYGL